MGQWHLPEKPGACAGLLPLKVEVVSELYFLTLMVSVQGIHNIFAFPRQILGQALANTYWADCSETQAGRARAAEHKGGQGASLTEITNLRQLSMWKLHSLNSAHFMFCLIRHLGV